MQINYEMVSSNVHVHQLTASVSLHNHYFVYSLFPTFEYYRKLMFPHIVDSHSFPSRLLICCEMDLQVSLADQKLNQVRGVTIAIIIQADHSALQADQCRSGSPFTPILDLTFISRPANP